MVKKFNTTKESYKPSDTLGNYLKEKLRLSKKERELITRGEDLSSDDKKTKRKNDRMKVHILNKHIFQAMANLTFFFEFIAANQELYDIFEDDIKELFGMIGHDKYFNVDHDKHTNVFRRLIEAILTWDEKEDPNNFRLKLIHILQNIIFLKINSLALEEFGDAVANNIVQSDMGRAWAWTKLYAGRVEKDKDDPDRPVVF